MVTGQLYCIFKHHLPKLILHHQCYCRARKKAERSEIRERDGKFGTAMENALKIRLYSKYINFLKQSMVLNFVDLILILLVISLLRSAENLAHILFVCHCATLPIEPQWSDSLYYCSFPQQ